MLRHYWQDVSEERGPSRRRCANCGSLQRYVRSTKGNARWYPLVGRCYAPKDWEIDQGVCVMDDCEREYDFVVGLDPEYCWRHRRFANGGFVNGTLRSDVSEERMAEARETIRKRAEERRRRRAGK